MTYDCLIIRVPEGTSFDDLTEDQQSTILQQLDARWIRAIAPGTRPVNGKQLLVAVVPRSMLVGMAPSEEALDAMLSDPAVMKAGIEAMAQQYGLDWELMYMRTVDAHQVGTEIDDDGNEVPVMAPHEFVPMHADVKLYLNPEVDEQGNESPATLPKPFAAFAMPGLYQHPVVVTE